MLVQLCRPGTSIQSWYKYTELVQVCRVGFKNAELVQVYRAGTSMPSWNKYAKLVQV